MNCLPPPMPARPSREIGSFFAALDENALAQNPQPVPWENGIPAEYVETGRQALSAIARDLSARGVNVVFLPAYLCESILEPLLVNSMAVSFLPMTDGLQIDLCALEGLLQQAASKQYAVLMVRYFGHARDSHYLRQITRIQSLGGIVIEDLTHSLFDAIPSPADYTFASFRKLLPVAAGAMVTGIESLARHIPARSEVADVLWMHMDSKREYLNGGNVDRAFYEGLVSATRALESTFEPHAMDVRSSKLLAFLPYSRFIQSRKDNFTALAERLTSMSEINVLNEKNISVATHMVLTAPDSTKVRQKLAESGVYCPIHWPRPKGLPASLPWKNGHFSVPIDHRYSTDDMVHVGSLITEILS